MYHLLLNDTFSWISYCLLIRYS